MLKALERDIVSMNERVVLLAPSVASAGGIFRNIDVDPQRHEQLVRDVQEFRGSIYLKDGAIQSDQLFDGLHQTPEDEQAWHMLLLDTKHRVKACALYLEHDSAVSFEDLRVRRCPLVEHDEWRPKLRKAIHIELERARRDRLQFVELGGWAVSEESRGTAGPLALALAVYGFSRRCGGALGMTTATERHCSSTILKRLGGSRFEIDGATLPPYFDPRYRCMMEMIRFDSRSPNPKYVRLIEEARQKLASVLVIARPDTPALQPGDGFQPDAYQPFLPHTAGQSARLMAS
jgi:hypothetical protein